MKILLEEVKHMAALARLELTEDDLQIFAEQLNSILDYMEKLNRLNTSGIEPTYHPLHIGTALREDKTEKSLVRKEAMGNAPHKDDNYFLVPKVI